MIERQNLNLRIFQNQEMLDLKLRQIPYIDF